MEYGEFPLSVGVQRKLLLGGIVPYFGFPETRASTVGEESSMMARELYLYCDRK